MNNFSSSSDLTKFFNDNNFEKIFIICGENSFKNSGAEKLLKEQLINKKIHFYFKKHTYPEFEELSKIISEVKEFSPELIIAIGGGSVLDYAKIANALIKSENLREEIINSSYKLENNFTKLVAIPTTAGSGAEVTSNAVI